MGAVRKDILFRAYLVYVLVLIVGIVIFVRIFSLVYINGDEYRQMAEENTIRERPIEASRGNIYSDDGSLLATSVPVFDIYWDAVAVNKDTFNRYVDALAIQLSKLFVDNSYTYYKTYLVHNYKSKNRYTLIRRSDLRNDQNQVSYTILKRIREFPIFKLGKNRGGLIIEKKDVRKMPYKLLASRTIGYERKIKTKSGRDTGYYVGLEGAYSQYLQGINGKRIEQRIRGGFWMPISEEDQVDPQNGKDIYSSINIDFQSVATHALMKQLDSTKADHGCVILMEVETGFIKAISNLTRRTDGSYGEDMNYAIWESAEPGSTFKLASLLAVLEDGKFDTNTIVPTGKAKYGDREMVDSHEQGYGNVSFKKAFEVSSNAGISNLVVRAFAGREQVYVDLLKKMGIGQYLNLEIQGEGIPFIKDPKSRKDQKNKNPWNTTTLPYMSIGYEIQVTPLHILLMYNTVANNGKLMKPQFVKEVKNTGEVIKKNDPIVLIERICSQKTIDKAKCCLEGVVKNGTAKKLFNTMYSIAGKTGTAQIASGGSYGNDKNKVRNVDYKASFVGYFPANKPKYSCIVVINKPKQKGFYGGEIAAPVFKEIADKVYSSQIDIKQDVPDSIRNKNLPLVKFGKQSELKVIYQTVNFNTLSADSYSEWVSAEETVGNAIRMKSVAVDKQKVPNVIGMGARDAVYLLESIGCIVTVNGKGMVLNQSIKANTPAKKGTVILLSLGMPDVMKVAEMARSMDSINVVQAVKDSINKMVGRQQANEVVITDTVVKDKKKVTNKDKKKGVDNKTSSTTKPKNTDKKKTKVAKLKDKKATKGSKKEQKVKKSEKSN
ncbi:MAG: penicillin-binding protein [Bacteroidota bacterium]